MYFYTPYVPLQVSDLKSGKNGYLSEDKDLKIIWNNGSATLVCKDCGKLGYGPHCWNLPEKNNPAICKKCNFLNEYMPEDPDYICYKCKNF